MTNLDNMMVFLGSVDLPLAAAERGLERLPEHALVYYQHILLST